MGLTEWDTTEQQRPAHSTAQLVVQTVKNLPAMKEAWDPSLGQEDPMTKEMATHSSYLAWRTPWTEEPGGLWPMEFQRVGQSYRV